MTIEERAIPILPSLASVLGIDAATFLALLGQHLNEKGRVFDDRRWVARTIVDWHRELPWLSISTLHRVINRLQEMGLLIKGNYNVLPFDRTLWYSIDDEKVNSLRKTKEEKSRQHIR